MAQPRPASFVVADQAASERMTIVPGGGDARGILELLPTEDSFLTSKLHSRASAMADDRVSSGELENPSNKNLFRAFQIDQSIHGNKEPVTIPAGGRHLREHRESQLAIKSIIPLTSSSFTNGASCQTL